MDVVDDEPQLGPSRGLRLDHTDRAGRRRDVGDVTLLGVGELPSQHGAEKHLGPCQIMHGQREVVEVPWVVVLQLPALDQFVARVPAGLGVLGGIEAGDRSAQGPAMAERIAQPSDAVTVELVGDRALDDRTGGHRPLERSIDITYLDGERARRPPTSLRSDAVDLGVLVGQHQLARADGDLGMSDAAVVTDQAADLHGVECLDVESQCRGRVADRDVRGDRLGRRVCRLRLGLQRVLERPMLLGVPDGRGQHTSKFGGEVGAGVQRFVDDAQCVEWISHDFSSPPGRVLTAQLR
jgi:hypothetical protein